MQMEGTTVRTVKIRRTGFRKIETMKMKFEKANPGELRTEKIEGKKNIRKN